MRRRQAQTSTAGYPRLPALGLLLATALASTGVHGGWRQQVLVAPAALHGANGMEFDAEGRLVGGSMMSGTIFRVDVASGALEELVPSPRGIADDLAIGPDGTIAWTTMPMGIVHARRPDGRIVQLARGLPLINSINFGPDGRLYAAQVTEDEGNLYELDPAGQAPPRVVMAGLKGLNGFEIDARNQLYGPLMNAGSVVRIDLTRGTLTEIATGFAQPAAVNLGKDGAIYVVDYLTGELTRIDPQSRDRRVVARTDPPVDNLAIGPDGTVYVSHPCDNGIEAINPETGAVRRVVAGSIGMPGGGTVAVIDGEETLLVAGMMCENRIDMQTGAVRRLPRSGKVIWSTWLARNDDMLVASSFAFGQLQWFGPDGGAPLHTIEGLDAPYAISITTQNHVLVAEFGSGRILRYVPPYTGAPRIVAQDLDGPVDFEQAANGLLYVTEARAGRVSAVDPRSGRRETVLDNLAQPEGLALLPDGRLAVAEARAQRLLVIDPATGAYEIAAHGLPIGMPPFMGPPETFLPSDVMANSAGELFMPADIAHTVLKFTPESARR